MKNRELYYSYMEEFPQEFENPVNTDSGIHIVKDPCHIEEIETIACGRLSKKKLPAEWGEVGVVYRDEYLTILRDAVLFQPGGLSGTYVRIFNGQKPPGVVVLPVCNGKVCLLKIFRHALRKCVLEVPRGFGDTDASPIQNADRELREETGLAPVEIHSLGYMVENSGLGNCRTALFFARAEPISSFTSSEGIDNLLFVDKEDFLKLIETGDIEDSFSISVAMRALLRGYI